MTIHMRRDLEALQASLSTMGSLVEERMGRLVQAMAERDPGPLDVIIDKDGEIDAWENGIEAAVVQFLALHQPVADDLRFVLVALRTSSELERMGDHLRNVAKAVRAVLSDAGLALYREQLAGAARVVRGMVHDALDALTARDAALADRVRKQDFQVDQECRATLDHLVQAMQGNPALIAHAVRAVNAVRNLERVADIATNLAKETIFVVEGHSVRHGGRMPA